MEDHKGDQDGFEQGWSDSMNGKPAVPQPGISFGMFDVAYLKEFKSAYLDGHATACREMQRRKALLQSKRIDNHQALERDNV
jgi:hypothetical protein